jgi:tRNA A-37 threonylcarbamoyl transferase component Bud32/tetratricopeptide (TPR) repeat protein
MADLQSQLAATLSGAYTIERELGGGGMSRVFVADELRLGRKVVVKVLSPDLAAGISAERFEREIKLAASLQQANIVPVLSVGETNGLPWFTMPFVEGESLRRRLGAGPIPLDDTVRILGDVARALQYAHERGIVHRDIKPDNVLLSGGTAVVTDFGIAKALSASRTESGGATLTQLGTSIGTPGYMAPEQAAGDPDVDHRADLYALGCMAYELLTGRPPFHGRTPQRVLAAHMSEAPQPIIELRPDLPTSLAALVMACLAKGPEDRPQNASDVLLALKAVTSGQGMHALPPSLHDNPRAFRTALFIYLGAFGGVAVVAKAATIAIGLPDWVFPGALIVMALGLPVILFTGYVQGVTRRVLLRTPALTPGGTQMQPSTMATIALKASPHVSWRRTTRGGMLAVGAFVVAILAFMTMRAFGIGPAASLFGAGRLNAKDPILVADFNTTHADSSIGPVVAEAVRASLAESPTIRLASASDIVNTLRLMQKPPTARLDNTVSRDIAVRQGYKAIVTGDVTGLGSGYVVTLQLVTADSGVVLASYQATIGGPTELIDGVDAIARKLRGKIGESLKSVQSNPPLAQVTTSSVEALRYYAIGARLNGADEFRGAMDYVRRAVAADSTFAEGWRKLAVTESNANAPQSSVDSALVRAYRYRSRLPALEALEIEAIYYYGGPGRDRAKGIAIYRELLQRGSGPGAAGVNLSEAQQSRREFTASEAVLRAAQASPPQVSGLALALIAQGKLAAAQAVIDSARVRFHLPHGFWYPQLRLYANESPLRVARYADSVRVVDSRDIQHDATLAASNAEAAMGRVREAKRGVLDVAHADAEAGIAVGFATYDEFGAIVDPPAVVLSRFDGIVRGDSATAVRSLDSAVSSTPWATMAAVDRPYGSYALAYAQNHRPDKARALLARLAAEVHDTSLVRIWQPVIHQTLAEIALDDHRTAVAIEEFRKDDMLPDGPANADPLPVLVNLARAFDQANQSDSAIVYFERYVATPSVNRGADDAVNLAGVYRRLSELYEEKDDIPKATQYTQQFIALWKNADPELQPKVSEARARLARLEKRAKSG